MSIVHPLFTLRCGDTWAFSGPLQDSSGNALALTGATIVWKLDSLDGKTNYITLTLGSGIEVTNSTTATVLYEATPTQTSALTPGTYYDSLRVTLQDGESYTMVEGMINALPSEP